MVIDAIKFGPPKNGLYVAEISELQLSKVPESFIMKNVPTIGEQRGFRFERADRNGEDVAGWEYVEVGHRNTPLRVLIIND